MPQEFEPHKALVAPAPTVLLALNGVRFRPGQRLAIGVNVQNPFESGQAELFVGVLLPDGNTVASFSSNGEITFASRANLSAIRPTQAAAPGFVLNDPGFVQFVFPTNGVPTGTYLVFAALLRTGALADNKVDADEMLAADTKAFAFSTGSTNGAISLLQSPFIGEYPILSQPFDHFYPTEFINANGIVMHYWGEQFATAAWPQSDPATAVFFDLNHSGYDFFLPVGTPLLAAGDGTVVFAGVTSPQFCALLNTMVPYPLIEIDHLAPNGKHFVTLYAHVSRIDVLVGQTVVAGQLIGLSGNTGCTDREHLHFQVNADRIGGALTDPYGWEGSFPDPWASHPQGGPSVWLWKENSEPPFFRQYASPPNPLGSTAPVTVTVFRWMGANDAQNPNNEFVEVTLDPRYVSSSTFDMTGYRLRNKRGDVFNFPSGFQMHVGRPVRIYTGPGARTDTELFWGLGAGVWDNTNDCARVLYPNGGSYSFSNATGACD